MFGLTHIGIAAQDIDPNQVIGTPQSCMQPTHQRIEAMLGRWYDQDGHIHDVFRLPVATKSLVVSCREGHNSQTHMVLDKGNLKWNGRCAENVLLIDSDAKRVTWLGSETSYWTRKWTQGTEAKAEDSTSSSSQHEWINSESIGRGKRRRTEPIDRNHWERYIDRCTGNAYSRNVDTREFKWEKEEN